MRSVLLRHFPKLTPAIQNVANPFAPWQRVELAAMVNQTATVQAKGK
jgi:hypothetical protein